MQTQALQQAESLFRSGDVGRAETLCAELIGLHPEDQRARRLFAEIALAWEGRADEAAAVLAELDLGADGGAGWPLLAEALVRLGRLDEARGLRGKAECGWIADVIARIDAGPVEAPPAAGDPDGRAAWLTGRALNAAGGHAEAARRLAAA
ncbi:MAG: hypothetical protein OXR84_11410, partial [Magnetovibrio sp.]|nr:hypothetical protein [Magnetovibrio sp.]